LVRNETRSDGREYSFFQVYVKLEGTEHRFGYQAPKPEKTAAVVRYGAFGDLIQASSVIALLKKQGYHTTLYTTKPGYTVTKHDPNIDKFIIQGKDQVPNHALPHFWDAISQKYDKFVNLSESVEGSLLALEGRTQHTWPKNLRHKMLNVNYLEFAHDLAEVPYEFKQKFYASDICGRNLDANIVVLISLGQDLYEFSNSHGVQSELFAASLPACFV